MNVVPTPELAPSICVICEGAHHPGDPAWVDTLRNFDVGVQTYLTGRKFVCGACAVRIGMAVGFFPPEEREALKAELKALDESFSRAADRLDDLETLQAIIERFAEEAA